MNNKTTIKSRTDFTPLRGDFVIVTQSDSEFKSCQGEVLRVSGEIAEVHIEFIGHDGQFHRMGWCFPLDKLIVMRMGCSACGGSHVVRKYDDVAADRNVVCPECVPA